MNQPECDAAKEAIFDLLGWGVPSEYLVDCGLSRQLLYYVFTELNLRLPSNLDIAGIRSYPPPPDSVIASSRQPSRADEASDLCGRMKASSFQDVSRGIPSPFDSPLRTIELEGIFPTCLPTPCLLLPTHSTVPTNRISKKFSENTPAQLFLIKSQALSMLTAQKKGLSSRELALKARTDELLCTATSSPPVSKVTPSTSSTPSFGLA